MKEIAYFLTHDDLEFIENHERPCALAHSPLSYAALLFASANEQHGEVIMGDIGKAVTHTIYGSLAFFIFGVGAGIAQAALLGL